MSPLRPLLLAVLLLAPLGAGCDSSLFVVSVIGDSHSDDNREPRHDWLPWAPPQWVFDGKRTQSGNKCWQAVEPLVAAPETLEGDVAVVFCGSNDAGRTDWDLDETALWILQAVAVAQSRGALVVVVAPPPAFDTNGAPPEMRNARLADLRGAIFAIADLTGAEVADLWSEVWAHPEPESLYADGLHFLDPGRVLMAQTIQAAIIRARK